MLFYGLKYEGTASCVQGWAMQQPVTFRAERFPLSLWGSSLCVGRAGSYSMAPIYYFCTESCELTLCHHYSMNCLSFLLGLVCFGGQTLSSGKVLACLSHPHPHR